MVRGLLLATAASMAMTVCAQAQTTGSIEVTRTNHDSGFDFDVTGVNGAIYHGFANGFGLQGEIQYDELDFGIADAQITRFSAHGLYRTESWAVGALVGTTDLDGTQFDHLGVEGAFYFDRWTLQGSYISGDLPSVTVERLNFSGRYFITENFSLGGGVALGSADEFDWTSYDLNAEYRFGGAPLAIFAGYNHGDFDDDTDSVRVGLRWEVGTGSLIERDRQGASFNDVETFMQDIYRLD